MAVERQSLSASDYFLISEKPSSRGAYTDGVKMLDFAKRNKDGRRFIVGRVKVEGSGVAEETHICA